jgi:hypothetical protein
MMGLLLPWDRFYTVHISWGKHYPRSALRAQISWEKTSCEPIHWNLLHFTSYNFVASLLLDSLILRKICVIQRNPQPLWSTALDFFHEIKFNMRWQQWSISGLTRDCFLHRENNGMSYSPVQNKKCNNFQVSKDIPRITILVFYNKGYIVYDSFKRNLCDTGTEGYLFILWSNAAFTLSFEEPFKSHLLQWTPWENVHYYSTPNCLPDERN